MKAIYTDCRCSVCQRCRTEGTEALHAIRVPLKTKRGKLTRQAFACGYTEVDGPFRLYMMDGVYFISGRSYDGIRVFKTARTLTEGRLSLRTIANWYGRPGHHKGVIAPKGV